MGIFDKNNINREIYMKILLAITGWSAANTATRMAGLEAEIKRLRIDNAGLLRLNQVAKKVYAENQDYKTRCTSKDKEIEPLKKEVSSVREIISASGQKLDKALATPAQP